MTPLARTEREVSFWLGHTRVGVAMVILGSAAGVGYLMVTPQGPNRALLLWVAVASLLSGPLVAMLPHRRIVLHQRGALFYYAWNLSFCLLISILALLDGGSGSPLVYFYPVNTIISSVAFTRRGAALMTACQVSSYLATGYAGGAAPSRFLFATVIAMVSLSCVYTAERLRSLIEQQEGLAAQLNDLANLDGLTDCLNYRSFHERLADEVAVAQRDEAPLSLVLVDLDEFKQMNDAFGHLTGDAVLLAVSDALRAVVRDSDLVARFGGDEFAVLAPGAAGAAATSLVERVSQAITAISHPMPVRASVGYAERLRGMTAEQLFQEADRALYAAKRRHRTVTLDHR